MADVNSLSTSVQNHLEISSFNDVPAFISETRNIFAEEDQYCHTLTDLIASAREEKETQHYKIEQQKKEISVLKQRISVLESTNISLKSSVTSSKIEAEEIVRQCDKKYTAINELIRDINQKKEENALKLQENLNKYPEEYHHRKEEVERIRAQYQQLQNKMCEMNSMIEEKKVREKVEMKKLIINFAGTMTIMKQRKITIAEQTRKSNIEKKKQLAKSYQPMTRNSNVFSSVNSNTTSAITTVHPKANTVENIVPKARKRDSSNAGEFTSPSSLPPPMTVTFAKSEHSSQKRVKTPAQCGITFDMLDATMTLSTQTSTLEGQSSEGIFSPSEEVTSSTVCRKKPKLFSRETDATVTPKLKPLFALPKLELNLKNFSIGNFANDKSGHSKKTEQLSTVPTYGKVAASSTVSNSESISVVVKKSRPTSTVSLSASNKMPTLSLFSTKASFMPAKRVKKSGDVPESSAVSRNAVFSVFKEPNTESHTDSTSRGDSTAGRKENQEKNEEPRSSGDSNSDTLANDCLDGRKANDNAIPQNETCDGVKFQTRTTENQKGMSSDTNISDVIASNLKHVAVQPEVSAENNFSPILRQESSGQSKSVSDNSKAFQKDHKANFDGTRTTTLLASTPLPVSSAFSSSSYGFITPQNTSSNLNLSVSSPKPMTNLPQSTMSYTTSEMIRTPTPSQTSYAASSGPTSLITYSVCSVPISQINYVTNSVPTSPHPIPPLTSPYSGIPAARENNSSFLGAAIPRSSQNAMPTLAPNVTPLPFGTAIPSSLRAMPPSYPRATPPSSPRAIPPYPRFAPSPFTGEVTPSPRCMPPSPRAIPPSPRAMLASPRSIPPSPRAMPPSPRAMPPSPRAMSPSPRAMLASPRSMPPSPRAIPPSPRYMPPFSRMPNYPRLSSPRITSAPPSTQASETRNFLPSPSESPHPTLGSQQLPKKPAAALPIGHNSSEQSDFLFVCPAPPSLNSSYSNDFLSSLMPGTDSPSKSQESAAFSPFFDSGFNGEAAFASGGKSAPNETLRKPFSFFEGENTDASMSGDEGVGLFDFNTTASSESKSNFFSMFGGADEDSNTSHEQSGFKLF